MPEDHEDTVIVPFNYVNPFDDTATHIIHLNEPDPLCPCGCASLFAMLQVRVESAERLMANAQAAMLDMQGRKDKLRKVLRNNIWVMSANVLVLIFDALVLVGVLS